MMSLFKSKSNSNKKDDGRPKGDRKKVKYVWVSSRKAIFIITGEPRESKYSYGIPIIPLHGYYRSNGKSYTAKELSDYYVILNLPKDADIDGLKGKKVVILGYENDALYIASPEEENDDNEGKESEEEDVKEESEEEEKGDNGNKAKTKGEGEGKKKVEEKKREKK
jgi:hypothetical protein